MTFDDILVPLKDSRWPGHTTSCFMLAFFSIKCFMLAYPPNLENAGIVAIYFFETRWWIVNFTAGEFWHNWFESKMCDNSACFPVVNLSCRYFCTIHVLAFLNHPWKLRADRCKYVNIFVMNAPSVFYRIKYTCLLWSVTTRPKKTDIFYLMCIVITPY
jgi:hypothetical protein